MAKTAILFLMLCLSLSARAQVPGTEAWYRALPREQLAKEIGTAQNRLPDTLVAKLYINLSTQYLYDDNDQSRTYALQALQISERAGFGDGAAKAWNNLGLLDSHEDRLEEALQYLHKSLRHFTEKKNAEGISLIHGNLGIVYGKVHQNEKAIWHFRQSLAAGKAAGAPASSHLITMANLAQCYGDLARFAEAIGLYKEILRHPGAQAEDRIIAAGAIGQLYLKQGEGDSAFYYFRKAESYDATGLPPFFLVNHTKGFGEYYFRKKAFHNALPYYQQMLKIVREEGNIDEAAVAAGQLAAIYDSLGDYASAYPYAVLAHRYADTLNQRANTALLRKVEADYELRRQDDKVKLLEGQQRLAHQKMRQSQQAALVAIVLALAAGITGFSLLRQSRLKARISREEMRKLEDANKIKAMESHLEGQLIERKRLAKDLHDNLGATLAGIKLKALSLREQKSVSGPAFDALIAQIGTVCDDVRNISHNLLPPEFLRHCLGELLEGYLRNLQSSQKATVFQLAIADKASLKGLSLLQKVSVFRILQEAISNAVLHAGASEISVLITPFEHHISFLVEDNGQGFDPTHRSDGIGLQNMRERARDIHAAIVVESTPGNGTVLQFNMPLNTPAL